MDTLADIVFTFMLGIVGTMVLASAVLLVFGILNHLVITASVAGSVLFIYFVGWCIKSYDQYRVEKANAEEAKPADPDFNVPVLDGLRKLEIKYNMTTLRFMYFVNRDHIPFGMDNLDYIEWLGLVNELSSLGANITGE